VAQETDPSVVEPDPDDDESVAVLLGQLARQLAALGVYESRNAAARHEQELRSAGRDVALLLVALVAFGSAFVLASAAAVMLLAKVVPAWLAALVLAAAWAALGGILALVLLGRARRLAKRAPQTADEARVATEEAVRTTIELLVTAMTKQIALAAVPATGELLDMGEDVLESADDMVEAITDELPGGGVVNQVWAVALAPGRLGIRVATTVLKRAGPTTGDGKG
jgi:membrane protein YqaA with SNARE-associated domain